MDIEKLIKEQVVCWVESNYRITRKMAELEDKVSEELKKIELTKLFVDYSDLKLQGELQNIEKAYEDGFRAGLKLMNSILNLGELEKAKIKEGAIGKRAG